MKKSLVIIVSETDMQGANELLLGIGWSDNNFLVPLAATPSATASHFGLRASVDVPFAETLAMHLSEQPALADALVVVLREDVERLDHFADVIHGEGLILFEPYMD